MKLSGSLLATVAALSLGWTAPAFGGEMPVIFRSSSAVLAPKVVVPASALFAGSPARIWKGAGQGVITPAKRFRDRPAAANVGRIRRSSPLERAGLSPVKRFVPGAIQPSSAR